MLRLSIDPFVAHALFMLRISRLIPGLSIPIVIVGMEVGLPRHDDKHNVERGSELRTAPVI